MWLCSHIALLSPCVIPPSLVTSRLVNTVGKLNSFSDIRTSFIKFKFEFEFILLQTLVTENERIIERHLRDIHPLLDYNASESWSVLSV